eukprot:4969101-Pleurochrysis_carterae.AAC.1
MAASMSYASVTSVDASRTKPSIECDLHVRCFSPFSSIRSIASSFGASSGCSTSSIESSICEAPRRRRGKHPRTRARTLSLNVRQEVHILWFIGRSHDNRPLCVHSFRNRRSFPKLFSQDRISQSMQCSCVRPILKVAEACLPHLVVLADDEVEVADVDSKRLRPGAELERGLGYLLAQLDEVLDLPQQPHQHRVEVDGQKPERRATTARPRDCYL